MLHYGLCSKLPSVNICPIENKNSADIVDNPLILYWILIFSTDPMYSIKSMFC